MKQSKQLKQLINLNSCPILIDEDYTWIDEYYLYVDDECSWMDDDFYLKESDFYPPHDDRVWKSNIEDIEGGDNFVDFCDEFFKMLEEEGYFD